ncbi:hypothetical protein FRC09_000888 [Ceratobasidium sp. 395]|nr:hypothetical protein FRC09_000888 [Ceratobasidium sp. 395]
MPIPQLLPPAQNGPGSAADPFVVEDSSDDEGAANQGNNRGPKPMVVAYRPLRPPPWPPLDSPEPVDSSQLPRDMDPPAYTPAQAPANSSASSSAHASGSSPAHALAHSSASSSAHASGSSPARSSLRASTRLTLDSLSHTSAPARERGNGEPHLQRAHVQPISNRGRLLGSGGLGHPAVAPPPAAPNQPAVVEGTERGLRVEVMTPVRVAGFAGVIRVKVSIEFLPEQAPQ